MSLTKLDNSQLPLPRATPSVSTDRQGPQKPCSLAVRTAGPGCGVSVADFSMPDTESTHEIVIRPTRGWFHLNLADIWCHRDLMFLLVRRDFVAKYKQTILGPAWFVLQPLLMTAVFTVIFSKVAKIPTDGLPPVLFYLAGLLGWNYFAQTLQSTSDTLIANANLFGKVYFPRLVVPLSAVISNCLAFGLQLATLLCVWTYFKVFSSSGSSFGFSRTLVCLPLLLVQIAGLSLGVGLWLSAMTAKYRDFTFLTPIIIQVWMYATPVIYPLSQISAKWRWMALLNPMTMPVESTKYMLVGRGIVIPVYLAVSIAITVLLLFSGVFVFNKIEKTFVDTV
jgi:lipopolysaccharide transport system permease protein